MPVKINHNGKTKSIAGALSLSASISVIMTLLLSTVIAYGINAEHITWNQAGYWIMVMLLITSFIGSKCAYYSIKRQKLLISIMSGLLYWGILLMFTALFWGGKFGSVWETAGIITAGCGCSVLLSTSSRKKIR